MIFFAAVVESAMSQGLSSRSPSIVMSAFPANSARRRWSHRRWVDAVADGSTACRTNLPGEMCRLCGDTYHHDRRYPEEAEGLSHLVILAANVRRPSSTVMSDISA